MWKKVIGPTLLVSLCWLTVSGATTYYIQWLYDSHELILRENVASIRAAGTMQEVLWRLQAFALDAEGELAGDERAALTGLEAEFERALVAAEQVASTTEEKPLVKTIREQFSIYREHIHRRLQLAKEAPGAPVPSDETLRLARSVAAPCKELLAVNERLMQERTVSRGGLIHMVLVVRLVIVIAGPAVGLVLGFLVARSLHRSISQIHVTLQDAASDEQREIGQIEVSSSADLPELHQKVQALVARLRDVAKELQEARRDVLQAERLAAVGELAAGVAHELRNPLTSVKLLIQTAVQRGSGKALGERSLQIVLDEIARMETTIQGLLDFARPPTLRRVPHDLRETLQRAINLVVGRAHQQGISVMPDLPRRPVMLDADPDQLHQVFVNLLLNGIEAMSQGGSLNIDIEETGQDGNVCRVRFIDSGTGIPGAVLERMFEPFVTSKERGTGLGLAVSRRIVEEHGGVLLAANRKETGAVFTVELPRESMRPQNRSRTETRTAGTHRHVQIAGH